MVKIISLSDNAYTKMKAIKTGKESFSDVVLRLLETRKRRSLTDFAGKWVGTSDEINKIKRIISEDRKKFKLRDVHELLS